MDMVILMHTVAIGGRVQTASVQSFTLAASNNKDRTLCSF